MLNIYKYHDDAKSLSLYNEVSSQMKLLDNYGNTWGKTVFAEDLSLIKNIISGSSYYALQYAINITKGRWKEAEPYIMKDPHDAYYYAKTILSKDPEWCKISGHKNGRWPDAEPYIIKEPYFAAEYAKYILNERWSDAESYIMKDEEEWEEYKDHFEIE